MLADNGQMSGGQTMTSCLLPQTVSESVTTTSRDELDSYRDAGYLTPFEGLDVGTGS